MTPQLRLECRGVLPVSRYTQTREQNFLQECFMPENEVKITVRLNGPYRVEGPVKLVDAEGREWDLSGKPAFSLCRCGGSVNKPFCDGTHSKIGFHGAEAAVAKSEGEKQR
jgi:CDGSH-type Zn-finger protein